MSVDRLAVSYDYLSQKGVKICDLETVFGIVLKRIRTELNLSQEELAFSSNLDRTYISLLERGKRQPSLSTIFALSNALNIKPSQLVDEVEKEFDRNSKA